MKMSNTDHTLLKIASKNIDMSNITTSSVFFLTNIIIFLRGFVELISNNYKVFSESKSYKLYLF